MEILAEFGRDDVAKVYLLKLREGDLRFCVEAVESVQPPIPRSEKWVILVSTLFGCPVGCPMCDAGGSYYGKLTTDEILSQVLFITQRRFNGTRLPVKRLKIQFARMGEPALNPATLDALERLPSVIDVPRLMPSISTVAPERSYDFFERLISIKNRLYPNGNFQLQFSIHTTDRRARDNLIPIRKWDFEEIAEYGSRWFREGDRKITLNFAASIQAPIEPSVLKSVFDPRIFLLKITPLNPTENARKNRLASLVNPYHIETSKELVESLKDCGFDVILSIGEVKENSIGSNCGQYITLIKESRLNMRNYVNLTATWQSDLTENSKKEEQPTF